MKQTIKNIISCLITICITVLLVQKVGHLLDPEYTEGTMDGIKAFHELEENSVEVIIYGSSHALKGCDPREMYKNYGIGAYNYGNQWQELNTTLLFLQDSLRTQTPKVVCIETYKVGSIESDTDLDGQIYYTREIDWFRPKVDYLIQCFGKNGERYASYFFPLIMFHDNWNQISSENFTKSDVEKKLKSLGFSGNKSEETAVLGDSSDFTQVDLPYYSVEILDEIVKICEEKNIQILFYTCPYEGEFNYSDSLKQYADAHENTAYIDLFEHIDEMDLNGDTDFQDRSHTNSKGARKVANFLGQYIVENYDVTDMRSISGTIWEKYSE